MNQGLSEYNYLYIKVTKMPYQLRLSDDKFDKADFRHFQEQFEIAINNITTGKPGVAPATLQDGKWHSPSLAVPKIKRTLTFYERPVAHLFFWVTTIGMGVLAWFMVSNDLGNSRHLLRFALIIVPGLAYIAYRLYGRKPKS